MSSSSTHLVLEGCNLSIVWGRLILTLLQRPGTEISPLLFSITGFQPNGDTREDSSIREALDEVLRATERWDVETVAFTIFPERYWHMAHGNRAVLYEMYRNAYPRLQAANRRNNRRGLYFGRLTMYGSGPCNGNQLEWLLSQYNSRKGVRRSMLQATTFDPQRDHVPDAQLSFPCLQHVSFVPTNDGLIMNAFYATQQLFDKAYGNYLGLCQLGAFMAHEMNISLIRVNVFVGVAKLERITKGDPRLVPLINAVKAAIASDDEIAMPQCTPPPVIGP